MVGLGRAAAAVGVAAEAEAGVMAAAGVMEAEPKVDHWVDWESSALAKVEPLVGEVIHTQEGSNTANTAYWAACHLIQNTQSGCLPTLILQSLRTPCSLGKIRPPVEP